MQDTIQASIDFPQENETVTSPCYTLRIAAPADAERVEVSIDDGDWRLCREAGGHFWYDWSNYANGRHEATIRIQPRGSRRVAVETRGFNVELGRSSGGPSQTVTQYSVLVPNEPGKLALVTQILQSEGTRINGLRTVSVGDHTSIQFLAPGAANLRRRLEQAGFPLLESQVFHLELPERAEALNRLTTGLAEKEINVLSLSGMADRENVKIILAVDRPEQAARLFTSLGINTVN